MVIDKGLGLKSSEELCELADYIDFVKLGFASSLIYPFLHEKINIYHQHGIKVYPGGTLFEYFFLHNKMDELVKFLEKYKFDCVEVSNGLNKIPQEEKLRAIEFFSKRGFCVFSEVGSKKKEVRLTSQQWVSMIKEELNAGAFKVITEARESGNIGIYDEVGNPHFELINSIIGEISHSEIIWEAPQKSQQVFFIEKFGPDVNLGNIAPGEVLALECLRRGLRADTMEKFLK